jgi:hypothetical protein
MHPIQPPSAEGLNDDELAPTTSNESEPRLPEIREDITSLLGHPILEAVAVMARPPPPLHFTRAEMAIWGGQEETLPSPTSLTHSPNSTASSENFLEVSGGADDVTIPNADDEHGMNEVTVLLREELSRRDQLLMENERLSSDNIRMKRRINHLEATVFDMHASLKAMAHTP